MPDPQAEATFARSKLDLERDSSGSRTPSCSPGTARSSPCGAATPALHDGRRDRVHVHYDEDAGWLLVQRGEVAIACNLAPRMQRVPLRAGETIALASSPAVTLHHDGVELPAEAVAIVT